VCLWRLPIAAADSVEALARALPSLEWVTARALPSGVVPEQADPGTGAPQSVTPLIWSHAALVGTVGRFAERLAAFKAAGTVPAGLTQ
jgi:GH15 family glucan-1,4-alpha-glucosidase